MHQVPSAGSGQSKEVEYEEILNMCSPIRVHTLAPFIISPLVKRPYQES